MSDQATWTRVTAMALFLGVSACGGGGSGSSVPVPTVSAVTAPTIATQPVSRVVPVGQAATFTVGATGSGLTYAWKRDGVAIAGATSASYTTPPTSTLDDGALFSVQVSNGGGSVTSAAAQLRIEGFAPTAGSMSAARQNHAATRLADGKVLLTGGFGGAVLRSAELYDPATDAFTSTGDLFAARQHHTATLLASGKVLVVGGEGGTGGGVPLATAELYDPATGLFSGAGAMHVARTQHVATLLADGKVLVTGGLATHAASGQVASAEVYDPATNQFTYTANGLSAARYWHAAALLPDGKVLVAGGYGAGGGALDLADVYDPATGRFSPTAAPMKAARYGHTATLLSTGMVLVAGGYGTGYLATAELFDPATATFALTGPLSASRHDHTATALPGGKVLVAGGVAATILAGAELYDPATAVFTPTGALSRGRYLDTATLLGSGEVLVAGGWSLSDQGLASAELYSGAP